MKDIRALRAYNLTRQLNSATTKIGRVPDAVATILASPWGELAEAHRLRITYLEVLKTRALFPDASLAQCAAHLNMSKDAYSAKLRRAFEYAEKVRA